MSNRVACILLFFTLGSNIITCYSQTDSTKTVNHKNFINSILEYFEKSNEVNNDKRLDISFIGGPHYSKDTKLGLGMVASGLYRIDRTDLSISPSNVSIFGDFTTSGAYSLGIGGNTIFPKDKYRLDINMFFSSMPGRYWGIGYDNGKNEDNYSKYTKKEIQIKVDFLKKLANYTYIGITGMGQHIRGDKFRDIDFLAGADRNNTAIGGGIIVSYDSRDFIPNPYHGLYLKLEQNFYPTFLGASSNFNRTEFIARYYTPVWKGGILAFDFQGTFNNGNIPWSMVSLLGGSYQMRGYYKGQYRDKKLLQTQVELRQKVYRRSGITLWIGAGNVFPDFDEFKWEHTLPTFGAGYRWEFKNRVNIRLDYGVGKGQTAFYFNINEAF
ncbi:MAG: outer membrane protein assembly factor [Prevotella sp.]|nr:outer membrane protein assembly factor [Prevotella sp.]